MTKEFKEYGLASSERLLSEALGGNLPPYVVAQGYTYTTKDDRFPSTSFVFDGNPFNKEIINSKNILEIGCGVGRNLPWIYENTEATYYGLDPNPIMISSFWKITDKKYMDRTILCHTFTELPNDVIFDIVISTFVFQHLGYRAPEGVMNVTDITQEMLKYTAKNTIWILFEHEREEKWIDRWLSENEIEPDVFLPNFDGWEELLDRGNDATLIIWKQKE